jgi:hypothetical protein
MVQIKECPFDILQEEPEQFFNLPDGIYLQRVELLRERMEKTGTDYVVIYGDREHFANLEYFTRYDCRFEEGLFILSRGGNKTIVVGNEGMAYSYYIPYEIDRIRYRHLSLQGQPRENTPRLREVFAQAGIDKTSTVGVVGIKYFNEGEADDPAHTYDIPSYMVNELFKTACETRVINYTRQITGLPDGLRTVLRTPEEAVYIEYQAVKSANAIRRMLKAAKPGISETELAVYAKCDLSPWQMYPLVNLTPRSVSLGLRSPDARMKMTLGEVFGLCYSQRGSLCSKVGIAAYNEATVADHLKGKIDSFYKKHWQAVAAWMAAVKVGVSGGELYDQVMGIIGGPEFGVTLNPGHYTAMDEWSNSGAYKNSPLPVLSASALQTDIIAAGSNPVMTAICEDTVIVADGAFRKKVKDAYPGVYARIEARGKMIREILNIPVSDDLMPVSPLAGVMFPYMLDPSKVYALE